MTRHLSLVGFSLFVTVPLLKHSDLTKNVTSSACEQKGAEINQITPFIDYFVLQLAKNRTYRHIGCLVVSSPSALLR